MPLPISIHAAREGGDEQGAQGKALCKISIHAAREGGDLFAKFQKLLPKIFQSTPPVKAATSFSRLSSSDRMISIHAAREGGDVYRQICRFYRSISIHAAREGGDSVLSLQT